MQMFIQVGLRVWSRTVGCVLLRKRHSCPLLKEIGFDTICFYVYDYFLFKLWKNLITLGFL